MAKVIKQGRIHSKYGKWAQDQCGSCHSIVEYVQGDIRGDQRDGDYVKCPVCGVYISVGAIAWNTDGSDPPAHSAEDNEPGDFASLGAKTFFQRK